MFFNWQSLRKTFLIMAIIILGLATALMVFYLIWSAAPQGYVSGVGVMDHYTLDWVETGGKSNLVTTYFIRYTYEGREYVSQLQNFSETLKAGQKVPILINIANPNEIRYHAISDAGLIVWIGVGLLYATGAVFTGLTVTAFIKTARQDPNE